MDLLVVVIQIQVITALNRKLFANPLSLHPYPHASQLVPEAE
jgi:hypothetical protein